MAFSITFGLLCMCSIMLLFLPAQGRFQRKRRFAGPVCCTSTSKARINSAAISCFHQSKLASPLCPVEAYILETDQHKQYCVDPTAVWLPRRLDRLSQRGIKCTEL